MENASLGLRSCDGLPPVDGRWRRIAGTWEADQLARDAGFGAATFYAMMICLQCLTYWIAGLCVLLGVFVPWLFASDPSLGALAPLAVAWLANRLESVDAAASRDDEVADAGPLGICDPMHAATLSEKSKKRLLQWPSASPTGQRRSLRSADGGR